MLVWMPQLPQPRVGAAPSQTWPAHVLGHWQLLPQVREPCEPHSCTLPGAHLPSFMHIDQLARPVLGSQVLVCVPQLPQLRCLGSAHTWPVHAFPHWH